MGSYLIKPFQRICKYPLFFKDLLRNFPQDHKDYEEIKKVFININRTVQQINENKRSSDNNDRLIAIQKSLEWNEIGFVIPLVSPSRKLMYEIKKVKMIKNGLKEKNSSNLLLFNDMILVYSKGVMKLTAKKIIPLSGISKIIFDFETNCFSVFYCLQSIVKYDTYTPQINDKLEQSGREFSLKRNKEKTIEISQELSRKDFLSFIKIFNFNLSIINDPVLLDDPLNPVDENKDTVAMDSNLIDHEITKNEKKNINLGELQTVVKKRKEETEGNDLEEQLDDENQKDIPQVPLFDYIYQSGDNLVSLKEYNSKTRPKSMIYPSNPLKSVTLSQSNFTKKNVPPRKNFPAKKSLPPLKNKFLPSKKNSINENQIEENDELNANPVKSPQRSPKTTRSPTTTTIKEISSEDSYENAESNFVTLNPFFFTKSTYSDSPPKQIHLGSPLTSEVEELNARSKLNPSKEKNSKKAKKEKKEKEKSQNNSKEKNDSVAQSTTNPSNFVPPLNGSSPSKILAPSTLKKPKISNPKLPPKKLTPKSNLPQKNGNSALNLTKEIDSRPPSLPPFSKNVATKEVRNRSYTTNSMPLPPSIPNKPQFQLKRPLPKNNPKPLPKKKSIEKN